MVTKHIEAIGVQCNKCSADFENWNTNVPAKPILKWVGGKSRLLPYIRNYYPTEINRYYEPFIGGLSVALDLRNRGHQERFYLIDLNKHLIQTYQAIRDNPYAVIGALRGLQANHSEWLFNDIKKSQSSSRHEYPEEQASRFIYLNKAGFNGLYRVNKNGEYNVGWGKRDKINFNYANILSVSQALKNTSLIYGDFWCVLDGAYYNDFVYLDPPYFDSFSQYTPVGFAESDHIRLKKVCDELNSRGAMFLQSNKDCPFIRDLYKDYQIISLNAVWSVSCRGESRGKKGELLIMNY